MKVTVNRPAPVVQPPATYTVELTEAQMNDLQCLADWSDSVAEFTVGRYGPRDIKNKLALPTGPTQQSIANTLSTLWGLVRAPVK